MACSLETVGKSSKNSGMEWPASRYSKKVLTGTRVPLNTGVPPRMSFRRSMVLFGESMSELNKDPAFKRRWDYDFF